MSPRIEGTFRDAIVAAGLQPPAIVEANGRPHSADVDAENGRHDAAVMNAPATGFPPGLLETGITDESYIVGNGEFLLAAFGDELADARPVVVSFEGEPASVPGK